MLTSAQIDDQLVRALADPTRSRIVELLAGEALCTCHLVGLTGARQTNLSNHLRVLREAGLVATEPCGRFTYYRLRPERLAELGEQIVRLAVAAREAYARGARRPCP